MFFSVKYFPLLFLSLKLALAAPEVGDTVCYMGYIIDRACVKNLKLFDNQDTRTLVNPGIHSVHCLIDMEMCRDSGFEMLSLSAINNNMHGRAFSLSKVDDAKVISFVRANGKEGPCTTCTGSDTAFEKGFTAFVQGTVLHKEGVSYPAVISVDVISLTADGTSCASGNYTVPTYVYEPGTSDVLYPAALVPTSSPTPSPTSTGMITGWSALLPIGAIVAILTCM